jgi:hypothetical protein
MASLRLFERPRESLYTPICGEGALSPLTGMMSGHRISGWESKFAPFWGVRASRFGSAAVVVARRGKSASARSSSVRRRAISDTHAPGTAYTDAVQTAPAESKQSAAGLDPSAVDPTWAPPEGPSDGAGRERQTIPAPLLYGSIVLVLVLLVVAIWGFGGFKKRTDILKTVPPGTLFTTGPYEFRFTEATAQHKKNFDGTLFWQVVMIGEGRTTGNESISPSYMPNSGMFISKDDGTQQISPPDSVRMGEAGSDRHHFTPGLPLSPYSVVFKYDDRYRPGHEIRFVVWDVVYGKHYLASDEEGWHNGTYGYQLHLPVRVLPPLI